MGYTPINYSTPNDGLGDDLRDAFIKTDAMFQELYNSKVDKVSGKGLSTNDFTDDEQLKLAGIADGAEVNVQSDLAQEDDTQDDYVKGQEESLLAAFPANYEVIADGITNTFPKGTTALARMVYLNGVPLRAADWSNGTTDIVTTFVPANGDVIQAV